MKKQKCYDMTFSVDSRVALYWTANVVRHWRYRTARVTSRVLELDGEACVAFHKEVAECCHRQPDNHECYQIEGNGRSLFVMFTDGKAYIGLAVEEGEW